MKAVLLRLISACLFLALTGVLSACAPRTQNDCGFVQNIYGQRISWKGRVPVQVIIHSSIPTELKPAIYRAAATWEQQLGRKIIEISEDSTQLSGPPSRDGKNGIYFLSDWESDRNSEQGRTSVYWVGDQIQEADIRINASNFSYYDQNPQQLIGSLGVSQTDQSTSDGYNFEALVLHEMGHLLGLKHRDGSSTVMATHLAAFTARISLAAVDEQSVSCEYK